MIQESIVLLRMRMFGFPWWSSGKQLIYERRKVRTEDQKGYLSGSRLTGFATSICEFCNLAVCFPEGILFRLDPEFRLPFGQGQN